MKTHKDLDAWKNAINLVLKVYQITEKFPKQEMYGLTNQIRRAAVSIPSNIAEGAARKYNKEFIQFLYVSQGSLSELETQLILSEKLEFISSEIFEDLDQDMKVIRSQISGLISYLTNKK